MESDRRPHCFRLRMAVGREATQRRFKSDFRSNTTRHFDAPTSTLPLHLQTDFSRLLVFNRCSHILKGTIWRFDGASLVYINSSSVPIERLRCQRCQERFFSSSWWSWVATLGVKPASQHAWRVQVGRLVSDLDDGKNDGDDCADLYLVMFCW